MAVLAVLLSIPAIAAALAYPVLRMVRRWRARRRPQVVWTALASLWSAPHDAGVPVDQGAFATIVRGLDGRTAPEPHYGKRG